MSRDKVVDDYKELFAGEIQISRLMGCSLQTFLQQISSGQIGPRLWPLITEFVIAADEVLSER